MSFKLSPATKSKPKPKSKNSSYMLHESEFIVETGLQRQETIEYNPLKDKFLNEFFYQPNRRKLLKRQGLYKLRNKLLQSNKKSAPYLQVDQPRSQSPQNPKEARGSDKDTLVSLAYKQCEKSRKIIASFKNKEDSISSINQASLEQDASP